MFDRLAAYCVRAFGYLGSDFGYSVSRTEATGTGFVVEFQGDQVGVRVGYQVGELLAVNVCLLVDSKFQGSPGEIRPDTHIATFDLLDIEAVRDCVVTIPDEVAFAVPDEESLDMFARRLQESAPALLRGNFEMVPALRVRVLQRAEAAARAKWGERASDFGW